MKARHRGRQPNGLVPEKFKADKDVSLTLVRAEPGVHWQWGRSFLLGKLTIKGGRASIRLADNVAVTASRPSRWVQDRLAGGYGGPLCRPRPIYSGDDSIDIAKRGGWRARQVYGEATIKPDRATTSSLGVFGGNTGQAAQFAAGKIDAGTGISALTMNSATSRASLSQPTSSTDRLHVDSAGTHRGQDSPGPSGRATPRKQRVRDTGKSHSCKTGLRQHRALHFRWEPATAAIVLSRISVSGRSRGDGRLSPANPWRDWLTFTCRHACGFPDHSACAVRRRRRALNTCAQ